MTQRPNDIWQLDYKLDHPVFGIKLGPPTPNYHAQAWHLPDAYEISINPQMAVFLEHRNKFFLTDLSFQIKTWREMVLYAPQPFVDLSHGVGLNTRPLGYAARTGSPDRSPQMLIGLNSHFTFNALPDLEVFISGVVPSNKNAVQMPENGSVVFFEQADKVMKSENVLLFITDHIQAGASGFMLATMSDYIGLYSKRIGKALTAPLALYLRWSDSATAGMKIAGNAQSGRFWPRLHSPKAKTSMEIPTSSKTCGGFWRMNPRISGK